MPTMKLTLLNAGQNYRITGGSDRYQFQLSELLTRHGHTVIPFAGKHPDNLPSEWESYFPQAPDFDHPGFQDLINYVYSWPAKRAMSRLLGDAGIDIAHLHIYYGKLTSSILQPLHEKGIPIVQTTHEFKLSCPVYTLSRHGKLCEKCAAGHYYHALLHRCNRGSLLRSGLSTLESYVSAKNGAVDGIDHFIAVSEFMREKLVSHGLNANRVTAIHNYIDVSGIEVADGEGSYLLYFGRFEANKGIMTLLEAAAMHREIKLVLVGAGGLEPAMRDYVAGEGLDNVAIRGFMDQASLHEVIKGSVCSIMPSEWYETFGLTSIESFGRGRPVIASRIGGIPEVVEDRVDGFLFEPGNARELGEYMKWMWENRSAAVRMGKKGRQNVERKFNPEDHYRKLMQVYRKLL